MSNLPAPVLDTVIYLKILAICLAPLVDSNNAFESLAECWKMPRSINTCMWECGTETPVQRLYVHVLGMGMRPYKGVFFHCSSSYSMQLFVLRHDYFTCDLGIYNMFRLSVVSMQINDWTIWFLK